MRIATLLSCAVLLLVPCRPALADGPDDPAALRAEIARLKRELTTARARIARLEARRVDTLDTARPPIGEPPAEVFGPVGIPVVRVVDGDTIVVRYAPLRPMQERIRMLSIDTPERGEPGYAEARTALARMLRDQRVTLEFASPGKPTRGNYGRLLAYVRIGGRNVNLELVRQGWTRFYTKYGVGSYPREFAAAQAEAKAAERGIWSKGMRAAAARMATARRVKVLLREQRYAAAIAALRKHAQGAADPEAGRQADALQAQAERAFKGTLQRAAYAAKHGDIQSARELLEGALRFGEPWRARAAAELARLSGAR